MTLTIVSNCPRYRTNGLLRRAFRGHPAAAPLKVRQSELTNRRVTQPSAAIRPRPH